MARVYQRQRSPRVPPWSGDAIHLDAFQTIFEAFAPIPNQAHPVALERGFPEALLWAGDITWRRIYLPEAILFSASFALHFPETWYYIARIDDHLDVCRVSGGPNTTWEDAIDGGQPIDEDDITTRAALEAAFSNLLEKAHAMTTASPQPMASPNTTSKTHTPLARLARCAGWTADETDALLAHIPEDASGYDLVGAIQSYCWDHARDCVLLHVHDWKAAMDDVAWSAGNALKRHLGEEVPAAFADFSDAIAIYEDGELERLSGLLAALDLELGCLGNPGDDYTLLIWPASRGDEARDAAQAAFGWKIEMIRP